MIPQFSKLVPSISRNALVATPGFSSKTITHDEKLKDKINENNEELKF